MAEKNLVRRILAIFDTAAARKAEADMAASLGSAGKQGGDNFAREMRTAYDRTIKDLKVQLAKGLIDPAQFKVQANLAAKGFNQGIVAGMEKARAAGTLTDREYLKLAGTLKRVGDIGEGAWDRIKAAIVRAAAAFAVAFGVRALIRFGTESIKQATDSEKVWNELAGTVNAAGESFAKMEAQVRANATAFQDATTHSDEEYANSLQRLIAITGDVSASIHNMNFVADVAARFFGGDLAAATDAVAKGMNTGAVTINRMKFSLEELAKRSLGAAAEQTVTFAGKVKQLNNQWDEFKEQIGGVLIGSKDTVGALDLLTGSVKTLIQWVGDNREALQRWVSEGVQTAITALETLVGWARTWLQLQGKLSFTAGTAPTPLAGTAKGLQAQLDGFARQRKQLEQERGRMLAELDKIDKAGGDAFGISESGAEDLRGQLQSVVDQLQQVDDNAARAKEKLSTLGTTPAGGGPRLGKNAGGADADKAREQRAHDLNAELERIQIELAVRTLQIEQGLTEDLAKEMVRRERILHPPTPITAATAGQVEEGFKRLDQANLLLAAGLDQQVTPSIARTESAVMGLTESLANLPSADAAEAFSSPWIDVLDEIRNEVEGEGTLFQELGEAWAQGGLKGIIQLAKGKVKENLARVIEELAKGFGALFTNPAEATAHFVSAGKHGLAAAAWGALASTGGGGGGGGGAAGAGGVPGPNLQRSQSMQPAAPEVHIYLQGHFDALNPITQRVVYGAMQEARQRFGDNSNVHIHRGP